MPEELLRNRNKHEKTHYQHAPDREEGTGLIEEFREFICNLLEHQNVDRFQAFHRAITPNTMAAIRLGLEETNDADVKTWLQYYLRR
jgi:hypothetical protein